MPGMRGPFMPMGPPPDIPGSGNGTTDPPPSYSTVPPEIEMGPPQETWQNQTQQDQHADLDNFFNDFPAVDLGTEMGGIYSSYNDPSLPLTGIDDVDWGHVSMGELASHLAGIARDCVSFAL